MDEFAERCRRIVVELGLAAAASAIAVRRLEGGVSSDIAVVTAGERQVCVKCALPRLKVALPWEAPVRRNAAEYAWLAFAATVAPAAVPDLHGRSDAEGGFAMAYLPPETSRLWKAALLAGEVPEGAGAAVGRVLGRIQAASAAPGFDGAAFQNTADFHALRTAPYLLTTAGVHPAVAERLRGLADGLDGARIALVHGDVSPKNIILRREGPVLLDAECATVGDPAFDLAFCLNHLVLKAVHRPAIARACFGEARALWEAYAGGVTWEPAERVGERAGALLPALMLARIDGTSPVEYLSEPDRARVRALALARLAAPAVAVPRVLGELEAAVC